MLATSKSHDMKKLLFGIILFCFLQVSCGQQKHANKGAYFISRESFFDRTLKPYHYQLTLDSVDQAIGIITFWRTQPIFDPIQKVSWTPNISFNVYTLADKEKCTNISLKTKTNSKCETLNIGGDMLTVGNFILLNTSPCVECSNKAQVDFCRYILKHLLEYITDTNSTDLNYVFGQLPIKKENFVR